MFSCVFFQLCASAWRFPFDINIHRKLGSHPKKLVKTTSFFRSKYKFILPGFYFVNNLIIFFSEIMYTC